MITEAVSKVVNQWPYAFFMGLRAIERAGTTVGYVLMPSVCAVRFLLNSGKRI